MFYSHEVLTSRKYGVATIWLVATLGSKSSLRKVNRKDIQAVNVKKACETIITPEAPMALRLQSNLLYGVSRVHSQQCAYVLADAQSAQQDIRTLFRVVERAQLDTEAGRARPEQLILPDDPAFLPDLALGGLELDAALFDFPTSAGLSRSSSLLAPSTALTEPSKNSEPVFIGGLDISSSSIGGPVDIGGLSLQGNEGPGVAGSRPEDLIPQEGEEALLPEPDFLIDAEGNIIDRSVEEQAYRPIAQSRVLPSTPPLRPASDTAASVRAHSEHEAVRGTQDEIQFAHPIEQDIELPAMDDFALPSDVQPFPVAPAPREQQEPRSASATIEGSEETSSEVQAPQRRRRQPKPLPIDTNLELRASDLVHWGSEYLTRMRKAREIKEAAKSARQAKQNAEMWVIGRGLGNVGWGLGRDRSVKNPILADLFSGAALWEGVTGIKRRRDSEEEPDEGESVDEEGRRVRARQDESEHHIGHGEEMELEEGLRFLDEEDVELPRKAPSALDAHLSDTMPWNVTASLRRSSVIRSGGPGPLTAIGGPSSAGGPSSIGPFPGSFGRRSRAGSRIVSASPLVGRGLGLPPEPSLMAIGQQEEPMQVVGDDQPAFQTSDVGPGGFETIGGEEFEFHGPGAVEDTQMVTQSSWVRAALDIESDNFLEFVKAGVRGQIQDREQYGGEEEEEVRTEDVQVTFEELLPPQRNMRLVAASGLLHVLSLASRGLLNVKQEEAFGSIRISVVGEL